MSIEKFCIYQGEFYIDFFILNRVLFPPNVSWVVLEMDSRSVTAQPEDTLTIYAVAGAPKNKCHCSHDARVTDPPFRKVYKVAGRSFHQIVHPIIRFQFSTHSFK